MNIVEKAKALVARNEVKEATSDFVGDAISGILGDPFAIGKIIIALAKSPLFFREQIFWTKFSMFLSGVSASEKDRAIFSKVLTEDGNKPESSLRLLECIERAETGAKIQFLINASRALSASFIPLNEYFRICYYVTHSLEEDLNFLREQIGAEDILYSNSVQGLLSVGLMYQSVIDANGEQKYSFTPVAEIVDRYAVSFNDIERYPNPCEPFSNTSTPNTDVTGVHANFA